MAGGSKQTTTSASEPWKGAQPALNQSIAGAQNLYNAGVGGQVYQGSTVVPWSQQTMNAMGTIENNANNNLTGGGISREYQGVINNGGFNAPQSIAMNNTVKTANSDFNLDANPAFRAVLGEAQKGATDAVNMNASAAGRYGSGTNQSLLAKNVGNLTNQMVSTEYNNWQNRKDAANNNLFGMGQQGFNNLGAAYTGMQAPATDLMNVGSMYEDLATRLKNDELRVFNESQNKPWEMLGRMNAIASGAGQMGGTTTQTQPGQNPFLTALGYGASGAGLLGSFL
jgi:hypothetical protein